MMIQMEEQGMEVDWDALPIQEREIDFPLEFQFAFQVWNSLSDQWDGMSGTYFGKQMSGIKDIMELLEISDQKEVFKLVNIIDSKYTKHINKKQQAEAKKKP